MLIYFKCNRNPALAGASFSSREGDSVSCLDRRPPLLLRQRRLPLYADAQLVCQIYLTYNNNQNPVLAGVSYGFGGDHRLCRLSSPTVTVTTAAQACGIFVQFGSRWTRVSHQEGMYTSWIRVSHQEGIYTSYLGLTAGYQLDRK